MNIDVFISHSSKDANIANAICNTLEANNIKCWIAPRDIRPGSIWANSINDAIENSKAMVLVFSENSNNSTQVAKELNLAINNELIILPFKIDNTNPTGGMKYYLSDTHWLDAINGNIKDEIEDLKDVLFSVLPQSTSDTESKDVVNAEESYNNSLSSVKDGIENKKNDERTIGIFNKSAETKAKKPSEKNETIDDKVITYENVSIFIDEEHKKMQLNKAVEKTVELNKKPQKDKTPIQLFKNIDSYDDELKKKIKKDPTLSIPNRRTTIKSGYSVTSDSGGAFRKIDENDEELIRMRKEKIKKKGLFDF